jgi:hypothetical protein
MLEIFKTDVQTKSQARQVVNLLKKGFLDANINFDLHDRDRILRVEGINAVYPMAIMNNVRKLGFQCELLQ